MPNTGLVDSDGVDLGNSYVTKEYVATWYPDLVESIKTPQIFGFGDNSYGQLGTNNITSYSSPVTTVAGGTNWKQVACGGNHTGGIRTDGTLWMWGYNLSGQLGRLNRTNLSSPTTTAAGGTNWKQVSCGYAHTAAIKLDGTLWAWGYGTNGQLGNNTSGFGSSKSSPVTTVSGGTNWKQVSCGNDYTAAIKLDGTLWTWGGNGAGQLGTNDTTAYSSPVTTAAGGTNWKQVSCGSYYTTAIKTDGTLWVWGNNNYGQLGDNTNVDKSSPTTTAAGGTNWKQVACGQSHTAVIKTDGTLWTWGLNNFGQLGDNTSVLKSSPATTAAGGTNWKQVACGGQGTTAVKTDGTLWVWGGGDSTKGQLGINGIASYSSPVTTAAGGTNWKQVACGYYHAFSLSESEGW